VAQSLFVKLHYCICNCGVFALLPRLMPGLFIVWNKLRVENLLIVSFLIKKTVNIIKGISEFLIMILTS
jgi:hypothetical protein